MKKPFFILYLICFISITANSQQFEGGFNAKEYADLLQLSFNGFSDSAFIKNASKRNYNYKLISISNEVGLKNKCAVYLRTDGTAIFNLRGTTKDSESWLANFYAAMINANGSLTINDSTTFHYQLAGTDKAYVHVGWMVSLAHLSPFINYYVDSLYNRGIKNFIISGHSQGGALSFLTTSYLYYKYQAKNIHLKTYASAAPKPGNLYYAYDFDFITRNGYGFRIVNTEDWVPETPLSVQTLKDINDVNPITNAKKLLNNQGFLTRLVLKTAFNKMNNVSTRTMKRYRNYLGKQMFKFVKKTLPQLASPSLVYSSNYFTAGTPIILAATEAYKSKFVFDDKNYFLHHLLEPYLFLLEHHYGNK